MVIALHRGSLGADRAGGGRVLLEPHLVVGEAAGLRSVAVVADHVRQVLLERSAAGHVEHLHTAADPDHGQGAVERGRDKRELEAIAHRLDRPSPRMAGLAVVRGIDVTGAAGDDQGVEPGQQLVR